jgi:hypothetical protein
MTIDQKRTYLVVASLIFILQDMVAFSCCVYDGGDEEKKEMDAAREIGWRGKFTKRGRVIRPGVIRMNGKCPLTPLEVCLYLISEAELLSVTFQIFVLKHICWSMFCSCLLVSLKQIRLGSQQNLS